MFTTNCFTQVKKLDKKTSYLYLEVFFFPDITKEKLLLFNKEVYDYGRAKHKISTFSNLGTQQGLDRLLRERKDIFQVKLGKITLSNEWTLTENEKNFNLIRKCFENVEVRKELLKKIESCEQTQKKTRNSLHVMVWIANYIYTTMAALANVKQEKLDKKLIDTYHLFNKKNPFELPLFEKAIIAEFKKMSKKELDKFWHSFQDEFYNLLAFWAMWKKERI